MSRSSIAIGTPGAILNRFLTRTADLAYGDRRIRTTPPAPAWGWLPQTDDMGSPRLLTRWELRL